MVDMYEAVVRDSTMWWMRGPGVDLKAQTEPRTQTAVSPPCLALDNTASGYLATSVSGMYFDESAYFLDCSTGFISRSKNV